MDLSRWIIRHADFTPDKTALRFEGKEISYAEFAAMIEALAAAMANKLDVSRGDRVAVLSLNSPVTLALLIVYPTAPIC